MKKPSKEIKLLFDVIADDCKALHKSPEYVLSVANAALADAYKSGKEDGIKTMEEVLNDPD